VEEGYEPTAGRGGAAGGRGGRGAKWGLGSSLGWPFARNIAQFFLWLYSIFGRRRSLSNNGGWQRVDTTQFQLKSPTGNRQ